MSIFQYQGFLYILKIICFKVISCYFNNPLVSYLGIKKRKKLITKKYFWPTLYQNIEVYIKSYNVYLSFQIVRYKPYRDF